MSPAAACVRLLIAVGFVLAAAGPAGAVETVAEAPPPVEVRSPKVALVGIAATLEILAPESPSLAPFDVEIRDGSGTTLARGRVTPGSVTEIAVVPPARDARLWLHAPGAWGEAVPIELRVIPGWLAIVPPLFAILLAILFRQVVPALLAGVWMGAWFVYGGVFRGVLRTLDAYVIGALGDRDRIAIIVFSMLLGGMVGVMSRAGGTRGLVDALAHRATDPRRGQAFTWLLGLAVFFDDYANTLVVGNTMRPVTDRLRISREKLAYIVDSTAAPVASIALISTWVGFEISLIGDALADLGSTQDAYWVFVQSIPYTFYPILALAFVIMVATSGRDFGPMLHAERRAATGKLVAPDAVPLSDFDHPALAPDDTKPARWINAVVPVATVLTATFVSQFLSGHAALAAAGDPLGEAGVLDFGLEGFGRVFSKGDSFTSLLNGSAFGCVAAVVLARAQGIVPLGEAIRAWIEGMKNMFLAFVILTLAWAIGDVCRDLGTADWVGSVLRGNLDPRALPTLIFVFSAAISFSTGSSWSTMSILIPLAVPSAFHVAESAGYDIVDLHHVLLGAVASVLAGSIFGDHCSPISDTTVMSSMASGCDHVDHVRTQLPYAVVVAVVAVVLGSVPGGFGVPPWISIVLGSVALLVILRVAGKRSATG